MILLSAVTLSFMLYYASHEMFQPGEFRYPPRISSHLNCPNATSGAVSSHCDSIRAEPRWMEYYKHIYDEQMARIQRGEKPRLALFSFSDGSGWGNRLRATHFMFLLALLTRRMLVIEHEDHSVHFESPKGFRMQMNEVADLMTTRDGMSEVWQNWGSACERLKRLPSGSFLERLYSEDIVRYGDGTSPDECLFQDARYHPWLMDMFGTTSRFNVTGLTTSFILSRPTPKFTNQIDLFKQEMRLNEFKYHIVIQFRAFTDHRPSYDIQMKIFDSFSQEAEQIIERFMDENAKDWQEKGVWVWFTSDDGTLADRFWDKMQNIKSRVHFQKSPHAPQHSSLMRSGDIKQPIVEWYLLGEVDVLISTGTTFGQFGAARTNWKPDFWVWQKDHLYKQPRIFPEYSCLKLDICF